MEKVKLKQDPINKGITIKFFFKFFKYLKGV